MTLARYDGELQEYVDPIKLNEIGAFTLDGVVCSTQTLGNEEYLVSMYIGYKENVHKMSYITNEGAYQTLGETLAFESEEKASFTRRHPLLGLFGTQKAEIYSLGYVTFKTECDPETVFFDPLFAETGVPDPTLPVIEEPKTNSIPMPTPAVTVTETIVPPPKPSSTDSTGSTDTSTSEETTTGASEEAGMSPAIRNTLLAVGIGFVGLILVLVCYRYLKSR